MPNALIAPNRSEWELADDGLEWLAAELDRHGIGALVQTPRDGNYSLGGIVIDELVAISVFLWERVRDDTVDLIVAAVLTDAARRMRKRHRDVAAPHENGARIGRILGSGGEVLREFPLDPAEPNRGARHLARRALAWIRPRRRLGR